MELNCIRQLYDYNRWADRRILAMASTLTNEDFIRPMGNSFSSVRDTLAHILGRGVDLAGKMARALTENFA